MSTTINVTEQSNFQLLGKPRGFDPRSVQQSVQPSRLKAGLQSAANTMPYFWLRIFAAATNGAVIIVLFTAL